MRVLGIETSCDETGIAIIDSEKGLLAHELYSQIELHQIYGGVVPELASRDHVQKAIPLVDKALKTAGISGHELDAVAYTAGPGLMGALLVGAMLGQSLAMGWGIKAVPVHHIEAHLLASMLEDQAPEYPFVTLLVSGGHTMLMDVKSFGEYTLLGQTLDDAAGEAFDKTAKIMGLGYPGGPALAAIADKGRAGAFRFPRPMLNKPGVDFSFSGLKTAVMQAYTQAEPSEQLKADVALGFEEAVVEVLVTKAKRALQQASRQRLVVAGGVAANQRLRRELAALDADVYFPRSEFCTDNGAMIAYTGLARLERGLDEVDMESYVARARWPLESLRVVAP